MSKDTVAAENEDDMDEDCPVVPARDRRDKHYSANEVDMELI